MGEAERPKRAGASKSIRSVDGSEVSGQRSEVRTELGTKEETDRSGWVYLSIGHSRAAAFSIWQTKDREKQGGRLHVYNERLCCPLGARVVEAVLIRTPRADADRCAD